MLSQPDARPLVAVVGPTGSGKSALAIAIAQRVHGEVVNCDSLQVYRHFDIGTAKLGPAEWQGVPHHLIDIADPDDAFSAGDYARIAREKLAEIAARDAVPVVTGGTGFYLRAMIDGLVEGPGRDAALRTRLAERESRRGGFLHRYLRRLDPAAAVRIHPNDGNKLIRAIELCRLAAQPVTELYTSGRRPLEGFRPLFLGLDPPRAELYRLLEQRAQAMFEGGLPAEVERILSMGYSPKAKPFESLGYKQALMLRDGVYTLEQAIADTAMQTRRYAKRQWTWFKRDARVKWIPGFGHSRQVQEAAFETIENSLAEFPDPNQSHGTNSAVVRTTF